ncbi:acyl carrier protein [Streptomyces olivaceiscleroticus]|uniref:Acyl carrier protein n=1 Tax=Streptomyces olivaceiscleroticus TaxID=68245 RepID=A0ABP3L7A5_9ACTN
MTMTMFTLAELVGAMRAAAGENEESSLDGEILEVRFADLGYDSLAIMETIARIERERGVSLPEDLAAVATPKEFITAVNACLGEGTPVA